MHKKTGVSGHTTPKQAPVKNKITKKGVSKNKKAGPMKTSSMVHTHKVTKKASSPKKA